MTEEAQGLVTEAGASRLRRSLPLVRHLPSSLSLALILLPATVGLIDCVWGELANFSVDVKAYSLLALVTILFWAAGWFYERWRLEPRLAAMLFCTSFLIGFTAAASVMNTMLVSVAAPRIDDILARADIALGFNWPALMHAAANQPVLLAVLHLAYQSLLPGIALAVMLIGTRGAIASVYCFVMAVAVGALICIFVWTLMPAFGAMSVYTLDPLTVARLHVPVNGDYGEALVRMLKDGPGLIAPNNMKGLIGFPSYHAVLALLLMWYFKDIAGIRWVVWGINCMVILSTPIEGGHHLVDVIAALPVTALAVGGAAYMYRFLARAEGSLALAAGNSDAAAVS